MSVQPTPEYTTGDIEAMILWVLVLVVSHAIMSHRSPMGEPSGYQAIANWWNSRKD